VARELTQRREDAKDGSEQLCDFAALREPLFDALDADGQKLLPVSHNETSATARNVNRHASPSPKPLWSPSSCRIRRKTRERVCLTEFAEMPNSSATASVG
jgi:hypothetical protein